MADYTPVALPGQSWTFTAGSALVGGDLVEASASNTVAKVTASAARAYVGVAAHDAAPGVKVTVILGRPIHESIAEGTIAPGAQLVTSSVAGRQVKTQALSGSDVTGTPTETTIETAIAAAESAARGVIGIALTSATDNNLVRWVQR